MPRKSLVKLTQLGSELRKKSIHMDTVKALAPLLRKESIVNIDSLLPDPTQCAQSSTQAEAAASEDGAVGMNICSEGSLTDSACVTSDYLSSGTDLEPDAPMDAGDNDMQPIDHYLPLNALQQAAYNGHSSAILLLLTVNADANIKVQAPGYEFSALNPLEIAEQRGHYDCVRILSDYTDTGGPGRRGWAARESCYDSDAGTQTSLLPDSLASSACTSRCSSPCGLPSGNRDREAFDATDPDSSSGTGSPRLTKASIDACNKTDENDDISGYTRQRPRLESSSSITIADGEAEHHQPNRPRFGVASADGYKCPTEDRIVITPISDNVMMYCVFDGHGGKHYSELLSKQLPELILQKVKSAVADDSESATAASLPAESLSAILKQSFVDLDNTLVKQAERNFMLRVGGTTAVVSIVSPTHVVAANVGDSPCIIFDTKTGTVLRQTDDHNLQNRSELERVVERGGIVVEGVNDGEIKVKKTNNNGQVAVTRAFGQSQFKVGVEPTEHIVSAEPQLYIWERKAVEVESERTPPRDRAESFSSVGSYTHDSFGENSFNANSSSSPDVSGNESGRSDSMRVTRKRSTSCVNEEELPRITQTANKKPRGATSSNESAPPSIVMSVFSDSFSEAIVDNNKGAVDSYGRVVQIIKNTLNNAYIANFFGTVIKENGNSKSKGSSSNSNCMQSAADVIVRRQSNKFLFDGNYHGDNTSIILVDLSQESL